MTRQARTLRVGDYTKAGRIQSVSREGHHMVVQIDNGPLWVLGRFEDADTVLYWVGQVRPDGSARAKHGPYDTIGDAQLAHRRLAPHLDVFALPASMTPAAW